MRLLIFTLILMTGAAFLLGVSMQGLQKHRDEMRKRGHAPAPTSFQIPPDIAARMVPHLIEQGEWARWERLPVALRSRELRRLYRARPSLAVKGLGMMPADAALSLIADLLGDETRPARRVALLELCARSGGERAQQLLHAAAREGPPVGPVVRRLLAELETR